MDFLSPGPRNFFYCLSHVSYFLPQKPSSVVPSGYLSPESLIWAFCLWCRGRQNSRTPGLLAPGTRQPWPIYPNNNPGRGGPVLPRGVRAHAQSLSHVQLFETSWTVAHQAPLSTGFSRQEYQIGLPFPSPGIELRSPGETLKEKPRYPMLYLVTQSFLTLCDSMDCSLQAPLSMGILQARILEWVAMPSSKGSS